MSNRFNRRQNEHHKPKHHQKYILYSTIGIYITVTFLLRGLHGGRRRDRPVSRRGFHRRIRDHQPSDDRLLHHRRSRIRRRPQQIHQAARSRQNRAGPERFLPCLHSVHRDRDRTYALSYHFLRSRHKSPGRLRKHRGPSPAGEKLPDRDLLWPARNEPGASPQRIHGPRQ